MAYTQEQLSIINSRNKNLIVSAAAGSGKTTVMIERIKNLIIENRVPISKFLVVTFTKASASDMKQKLAKKLAESQPDAFVFEQIDDIATADVSNLHSFCARLLKTYFYEAGLDPTFVVLAEEEANELKQKALNMLFDEKFEQGDLEFYNLFDCLGQNRSDKGFRETILQLNDFFNVIFDKEKWFKKCIDTLYNQDLSKNTGAKIINSYVCNRIEYLSKKIDDKIKVLSGLELTNLVSYLQDIQSQLLHISKANNFVKNAQNIAEINNFKQVPKTEEAFAEYRQEIDNFRKQINKELANFKDNFISSNAEQLKTELSGAKRLAQALFDATNRFVEIYKDLKIQKCGLDYNDLEQHTLAVLDNENIRKTLLDKYQYVFVDEYQDINDVQEKIISLLSKDNNRFMVGDVKQSIYGFRLCDPQIFLDKFEKYATEDQSQAINLSKNFRSNKHILNFVNTIFAGRMTKDFGGVDYQKDAMLQAGVDFEQAEPVKLVYLDTADLEAEKTNFGKVETGTVYSVKNHKQTDELENLISRSQSQYIATEILDLVANKTIFDTNTNQNRSIRFKDIAILIPARNQFLECLLEVLKANNIPASTDLSTDIMQNEYVKSVQSYLELIYNSNQDIQLFNVLYGPIGGFTLNELADLRKIDLNCKFFYKTLNNIDQIKQKDAKLWQKVTLFNQNLQKFKQLAGYKTTKELANEIIKTYNIDNFILAEENGELQHKLMKKYVEQLPDKNLYEYFADYNSQSISVSQENNQNAVQIVTIHKSKGLEYKVCFVANIERTFNLQSTRFQTLTSKTLGLGIDYFNETARTKNKTIAKEAIKLTQVKSIIEEEQRLLYVALTRAINKLYVVGAKNFEKLHRDFPERQSSFADWFDSFVYDCSTNGKQQDFEIICQNASNYITYEAQTKQQVVFGAKNQSETNMLTNLLSSTYAFEKYTKLPQKTSVTEIASGYHESEEVFSRYNPQQLSSNIEKGNAYHKLMQYIDFSANTMQQLDEIIQILLKSGKITENELKLIDKNAIIKLLNNQQFLSIISNATILREQEFFMNIGEKENVQIVQGVIDLAAIKHDNSIIVVDYKTGNFSSSGKLQQYSKQLSLYGYACKKIYGEQCSVSKYIVAIEQGEVFLLKS